MDIPLPQDLNVRTPISVNTGQGVVHLFVLRSTRGRQDEQSQLTVEAICAKKTAVADPCHVFFRGNKIECRFTQAHESDGLWLVTLVADIAIPEYWGET